MTKSRGGRRPFGKEMMPGLRLQGRNVWTENATPGKDVYGETLRKGGSEEWRRWDPRRSKLGAGLMRTENEAVSLLPATGSRVLYLSLIHI